MPRFSQAQRDRVRAILLDRAARLFADRPYGAVTVEDVAAVAGVAKGTVYSFFDGKEELFRRVLEQEHDRFHREVEGLLAEVDVRCRENVREALHAVVHALAANPLLLRVLDERDTPAWLEVHRDPSARMAEAKANTNMLVGLIREGQLAGVMRDGDPVELAGVIGELFVGLLVAGNHGGPEVLRRLQIALDLMVDGLYTRGPGPHSVAGQGGDLP